MKREETWILEEKYGGTPSASFYEDIKRFNNGVPLAYIIGFVPFLSTKIFLDSHPLIPRTETEFWVAESLIEIEASHTTPLHVLDLCAGSGCIGVAVASRVKNAHIDFIEINSNHTETIKKNCAVNGIDAHRYTIYASDLFSTTPPLAHTYSYILTNPPYINKDAHTVSAEVEMHEPHEALFGGTNGFECIENIIKNAKDHLTTDGVLYIEHEPQQVELITHCAKVYGYHITTHTDQYNIPRYSRLGMSQL